MYSKLLNFIEVELDKEIQQQLKRINNVLELDLEEYYDYRNSTNGLYIECQVIDINVNGLCSVQANDRGLIQIGYNLFTLEDRISLLYYIKNALNNG